LGGPTDSREQRPNAVPSKAGANHNATSDLAGVWRTQGYGTHHATWTQPKVDVVSVRDEFCADTKRVELGSVSRDEVSGVDVPASVTAADTKVR